MGHRIVSTVIGFLLLLFAGGALLFGVAVTPPRGTAVLSPPATHRAFDDSTCATCHR